MANWTLPQKTKWMASQMNHEPTRQYAEELSELVALYCDSYPEQKEYKMLEIGCAWGVSTLSILLANKKIHLTSVDKNETKADQEVAANDLLDRWNFINCPSETFWGSVSKETYDLIYIDGSHLYDDVKNDLLQAWDRITSGGLLIIDDYTHPKNIAGDPTRNNEAEYGISLACWELISEKQITDIRTTSRFLVMEKL
jgi:predicted O-methyltransferase YrrM